MSTGGLDFGPGLLLLGGLLAASPAWSAPSNATTLLIPDAQELAVGSRAYATRPDGTLWSTDGTTGGTVREESSEWASGFRRLGAVGPDVYFEGTQSPYYQPVLFMNNLQTAAPPICSELNDPTNCRQWYTPVEPFVVLVQTYFREWGRTSQVVPAPCFFDATGTHCVDAGWCGPSADSFYVCVDGSAKADGGGLTLDTDFEWGEPGGSGRYWRGEFANFHARLKVAGLTLSAGLGANLLATDATGTLWIDNATTQAALTPAGVAPHAIAALDDGTRALFLGADGSSGDRLWTTDGTAAGTKLLTPDEVRAGPWSSGRVLFAVLRSGGVDTLTATDGTTSGTFVVRLGDGTIPGVPLTATRSADRLVLTYPRAAGGTEFVVLGGAEPHRFRPGLAITAVTRALPFGDDLLLLGSGTDTQGTRAGVWTVRGKLSCPPLRLVEAVGPSGAQASWEPPPLDAYEGTPTLVGSASPGALFPLGDTTVTYTVSGIGDSCSFTVRVRDTRPPVVTCPSRIDALADASGLAIVTFQATASDLVSTPVITSNPPSGSAFPSGSNFVAVRATDAAGNVASCSLAVVVHTDPPPWPRCPTSFQQQASGPGGAPVTFTLSATDVAPNPVVVSNPPSGSLFPFGVTPVRVTATSALGPTSSCAFDVTVRDTLPPSISCRRIVEAQGPSGAVVEVVATATDLVSTPTLTSQPEAGSVFPIGVTVTTTTATDAAGNRATCLGFVTVSDTTPPSLVCPGPLTFEADGATGAIARFNPTALDLVSSARVTMNYSSGTRFPLGTTQVLARATDSSANASQCAFDVVVRDTTAPTVRCPIVAALAAQGPEGAIASFSVTATDRVSTPAVITHPLSGSLFAIGTTLVTASATDAAGNVGQCTFDVVVRDTGAPTITCPSVPAVEALGPEGAIATFSVTATDRISTPTIVTTHLSGSPFPIGTTTVTASATDAAGNVGRCTFDIVVRDTTRPTIACPTVPSQEAQSPEGARVTFSPLADDLVSTPAVVTDPPSGSLFPLGKTAVTARATDAAGNLAECTFLVGVRDSTAPTITCPTVPTLAAQGPEGAIATFSVAASDLASTPTILTDRPSGSMYPIGATHVTARATDPSGNWAQCSFVVDVRDTTPPHLTCPGELVLEAAGPEGALGVFEASAIDAVSASEITSTFPSGSTFPIGETTVQVLAVDQAGNRATCAFGVAVRDTTPPSVTCPRDLALEAQGPQGAVVAYAATAQDLASTPIVALEPVSASTLPLGTTEVVATAADDAGNVAWCRFAVLVRDTTPPEITCPDRVVLEATDRSGARATYAPRAADGVSTPTIVTNPASGSVFSIGTTSVVATAADEAGNASQCAFDLEVRDTTPPELTCPGDVSVTATDASGARATFRIAADDRAGTVRTVAEPASGSVFPMGTTQVTVRATDERGLEASCRFDVLVAPEPDRGGCTQLDAGVLGLLALGARMKAGARRRDGGWTRAGLP